MSSRTLARTRRGGLVAAVAVPLAFCLTAGQAAAATGTVKDLTNTETVQITMSADGKRSDARVYEQLAVTGDGVVEVVNPVSAKGLRNLDGFGGFSVKDGKLVAELDAGKEAQLRTVSEYDGKLPLELEVTYRLNGKEVKAKDVVGKSGDLQVTYRVTNTSAQPREVTYDDGSGTKVTETLDVVVPMVGTLTTTLPAAFKDVYTTGGNVNGDGKGGTQLTFTLTLFPPIGSDVAEFGWSAKIRDGVVPAANLSAMPVQPLESQSLKGGAASYQAGAGSGHKLAFNASIIDANLLKLHDGSASLLAGILQLRDGADQLSSGLQGEAAPGAAKLADGAVTLDAGATSLAEGASKAAAGAKTLADGTRQIDAGLSSASSASPALVGGLKEVSGGLAKVDAGLAQLSGAIGELGENDGVRQLKAGIAALQAGIGSPAEAGSLLNGLARVNGGLTNPSGVPGNDANPPGLKEGLAAVGGGLTSVSGATGNLSALLGCDGSTCAAVSSDPKTAQALVSGIQGGLAQSAAGITTMEAGVLKLIAGVDQLECGLDNTVPTATCDAGKAGVKQGLALLDGGIDQLVAGVTNSVQQAVGTAAAPATLRNGIAALAGGTGQLQAGAGQLSGGLGQLSAGSSALAKGSSDLAAGVGALSDGAGKLADGTGTLADGAGKIATGLEKAADGSGKLAEGLGSAAEGAPQIVNGTKQLSTDGMSLVVGAGRDSAKDYGSKYALIEAANQRAATDGMAYGAPEGARGLTAYSFELAGEDGEGGRNTARGLGALAVFGLGAGVVAGLRRKAF